MANGLVTPSEVKSNLNLMEKLTSHLSGDDDYKAAMLQNQKIMTEAMLELAGNVQQDRVSPSNVDINDLPLGLAGSSVDAIPENETGRALFDISGSKFEARVEATAAVQENETVVVTDDGNMVRPSPKSQNALSMLTGAGAAGRDGIMDPDDYEVYETDMMEYSNDRGSVILEPGQSVPIVSTGTMPQGGYVMGVGATDEQGVEYELQVDGGKNVGGITGSPLGTINSPFSFPSSFGAAIPAAQSSSYIAHFPETESGTVELVGRLHVEEF